ncbi:cyclic AMP-dependent transcription factor ATF-3 isoform X2 [Nematostella vectensis]|uniref:cyclic AMP-dependent transcription factor ATF-3 isoform X2 n=1 Tax=Nematostella vectensis TaxID=45351 RepID=UPI00207761F2|nr:cyclic AMP-dependent transcription factor ATF-3 isoform X2 [Nematostella vectensis]
MGVSLHLSLEIIESDAFSGGSGVYMDPTVIRSAAAVNSGIDALSVDPNFDIAELPVKLELRYVIESKRAANGLDCPKIEYNSSPQYEELTPEEETRRKVRRQRNKVAASKCRLKRREHVKNLLKASEELESANSKLESDIACLNAEKEQLERMLDAHKCISKAEIGASRGPA